MSFLHKLLWFVFHWIADLIEQIYFAFLSFRRILTALWVKKEWCNDNYTIQCNVNHLKKTPQHVAVILNLNHEKADFDSLTKIIFWSLHAGISYLSFYDYEGETFLDRNNIQYI